MSQRISMEKIFSNRVKSLFLYLAVGYMAVSMGKALPGFMTVSISSWLFSLASILPGIILVAVLFFWVKSDKRLSINLSGFLTQFKTQYLLFISLAISALFCGIILSLILTEIPAWQFIGFSVLGGAIIWFLLIGIMKPELGPVSFLIIYSFLEFARHRLHARWYELTGIQGAAGWLKSTVLSWQNHEIILVVFAIGFIMHLFTRKKVSLKTSIDYPIIFFLIWAFISILTARNSLVAVNVFMAKWLLPFMMFYATIYALRKNIKIDTIGYSLIILLFLSCLLTIQNSMLTGSYLQTIDTDRAKVWGAIGGQVGPWIVMILPIAIYYLFRINSSLKLRMFIITTVLLSLIMIVWEMQRGVLLALMIIGIISLIFYPKYWRRFICLYLIVIVPAIIFREKIIDIILLSRPALLNTPLSVNQNFDRWHIWQAGLDIVKNNPILGIGPGGFWLLQIGFHTPEVSSHNMILETALESGIIASVLLVVIYFSPLYQFIKRNLKSNGIQKKIEYDLRPWVIALLGYFVFLMLSTCWKWAYGVVVMIMLAVVASKIFMPQAKQKGY